MNLTGLYAIVDLPCIPTAPVQFVEDCLRGGAPIVQLRDKRRNESDEARRLFRETAAKIASLKRDYRFLFIVNDDLDVAIEVDADGIHVGKDDLSIAECRRRIGSSKLIGYSSHALAEAVEAEGRGADYVAFGAIYPSPTKGPGHPVQGIGKLREVVLALKVPVVAIGGIGRSNIEEVLATGVASVAMISALTKASDPSEEVRFYLSFFL